MRLEVPGALYRLRGMCSDSAGGEECWHGPCLLRRRFADGKLLIENRAGYLIAVEAEEVESFKSGSRPNRR